MGLALLIRDGTVVDGSGMPRYRADVGVESGRIVEIGRIRTPAERTIDASGLIVAPGFIDGHTHMDAQVAWDPLGSCSCWHGVTSVVMGYCGFALAPCKPGDREWFARCLTAVEDIPTESMMAGIDWTREIFPEYLAIVERLPKAINYGIYIGHSALRMNVMGRRGLEDRASEEDLHRMAAVVDEAMRAGAMGLSTSRATTHVTPDGSPVASRIADWEEIDWLVGVMAALDAGIFQIGPDISGGEAQRVFLDRLRRVALDSGRPIMFGVLATRQGGDATTTDPRKPDYANFYPMLGVDWDDPSVADLARQSGKHPVETIIDLCLADDNRVFVQPLVNESPGDVLGILKHPRTLATFSDSGAHVCQEMGSSLQTHLLSYWVRNKRQLPTVEQDLPGGARRLVQKADGIAATIVNGTVAVEDGDATGDFAGQVLKGRLAV